MSGITVVVMIFFFLAAGLGAVAYFTYQRKLRRAKAIERGLKMVPILIHLPPHSSDTQAGSRDLREVMREKTSQAEVLYNLISGTATEGFKSTFYGQRHIALEVIAIDGLVHFFAAVPVAMVSVVQKAILTAYPGARLEEVEDHNIFNQEGRLAATLGGEMVLRQEYSYPIATYGQLERDPMEALLTTISALEKKDGVAIQIMLRPANRNWTQRPIRLANGKRKGRSQNLSFTAMDLAKAAVKSPDQWRAEERARMGGGPDISNLQLSEIEKIEEKTKHPGFEVLIRVIVSTESVARSQQLLRDIATTFALFETPGLNGFKFLPALDVQGLVTAFIFRFFPPELKSNVLNSVELATLFHFPDSQFTPSASVERQKSKQVDGPVHLPATGLLFGYNEFRGVKKEIRLSVEDRRRHTYILGQTGTGKSTMLENLAVQDMLHGNGFAFIDPHGDSAEKLLAMVPKERAEDIIYFNPADAEYPLGLNLFEFTDPAQKDFLVQETINMLYKLYDPGHTGIIGPRYEHWYRNAALTLMSDPNGATFIEIPKVFTDTEYLKQKFQYLNDPTVIDFWTKEMGQTSDYHKSEMLGWFVSKFGAFQNNEMMRNIIGQVRSSFNMRDVMDHKKILIVNLSKGRIGELNSQLLGMIFVIKLQAAAMSRANVPEAERPDFCLYVDEFQNFSTDSFASILSEARKYRLNLVVANQFIGQLSPEIRDAVFGNIGTIVAHRMGPEDAEFMVKQYAPVFDTSDLVNIPNYNAAMRLMIGGLPSQPFTMRDSAPLGQPNLELGLAVKQLSAAKYGHSKAVVEADILERFSGRAAAAAAPAPAPAPAPAQPAPLTADPATVAAASAAQFAPVPPDPAQAPVATATYYPAPVQPATPVGAPTGAVPVAAPSMPAPESAPQPAAPVVNTAGQIMTAPAPIIPDEDPGTTQSNDVAMEGGFGDLNAPLGGPAMPPPGQPSAPLPGMATTPPPIGAPPVDIAAPGTVPPIGAPPVDAVSAPQAAPAVPAQQAAVAVPPPIGAPPVELPVAPAAAPSAAAPAAPLPAPAPQPAPPPMAMQQGPVAPAVPVVPVAPSAPVAVPVAPVALPAPVVAPVPAAASVPVAAPAPVAAPPVAPDAQTLSLADITGGRVPAAPRAVDLTSVPVIAPGAEPPPPAVVPLASQRRATPPVPVVPLGSGVPLEGDPYANIPVLGDLTPPGSAVEPPAVAGQPVPTATGKPLPNDPYADIDVLGAGAQSVSGAPARPAAAPPVAAAPALMPTPPIPVRPPAPMAAPAPIAAAPVVPPLPAPVAPPVAPPVQVQPPVLPTPVPAPAPISPPPAMPPADVPVVAAPVDAVRPAVQPAQPVAPPVQSEPELPDEPLIHFIDPTAEEILKRPDVPDAVTPENDTELMLSGLPDGVQLLDQAAPQPSVPVAPVPAPAAPVAPAPAPAPPPPMQPTPVPTASAPLSNMAKTPPPIGAAPVDIGPASQPAPVMPSALVPEAPKPVKKEPIPEMNANLAKALTKTPPPAAPKEDKKAEEAPQPVSIDKIKSVADMLDNKKAAEAQPDKTELKPEQAPEAAPAKSEAATTEAKAEAKPDTKPAIIPDKKREPVSSAVQIEKAEHEIDDLLSQSLIRPDSSTSHRRLPEPVALPPQDETGVDLEMNAARALQAAQQAPPGTPQHMATQHHGLKVIQPLEPIVPPKEQFAKELAALQKVEQAAEKAQSPAAPAPQGPPAPPPAQAPPLSPPVPSAPPTAAQSTPVPPPAPQSAASGIVKHDGQMMAPVPDEAGLPQAESLAVEDVARARAEREATMAMQKAAPVHDAPVSTPRPQEKPEKPAEVHKEDKPRPKHEEKPKQEEKAPERIESEEEAEHNKPTEAGKEQGAMVGKLIVPTGDKPRPEPVQPKTEKPKKLAPGEVFVDEHGNVIIGE